MMLAHPTVYPLAMVTTVYCYRANRKVFQSLYSKTLKFPISFIHFLQTNGIFTCGEGGPCHSPLYMASGGLGVMFEGDFVNMCAEKFLACFDAGMSDPIKRAHIIRRARTLSKP